MTKNNYNFEGSESELVSMTADLDSLHHDLAGPALADSVAGWSDQLKTLPTKETNRRIFLLGAGGALAGGAAMMAMASAPGLAAAAGKVSATPNSSGGLGGLSGDLAVAGLAASLENLAVYAYNAAISAATGGKFGTVPPAIVTFAETAMSQHTDHAAAWNAILTASGKKSVSITEPTLTPVVNAKFAKVTTLGALATLAIELETIAAQTYQVQSTKLKSKKAIETAATIQPVEMQHIAILYFVLGKYPGVQTTSGAPVAFSPTSMAAS